MLGWAPLTGTRSTCTGCAMASFLSLFNSTCPIAGQTTLLDLSCCNVLQRMLQCGTVCCSVLLSVAVHFGVKYPSFFLKKRCFICVALLCVALCYNACCSVCCSVCIQMNTSVCACACVHAYAYERELCARVRVRV